MSTMYMAKNKATGQVTGPFTEAYKNDMENNRSTWKRHIWTAVTSPKPAVTPTSIAEAVKAAKNKADGTSAGGE